MENKKTAIGTYGYIDELKKKSKSNMMMYAAFAAVLFALSPVLMKSMVSAFSVAAVVMLIPAFQGFKQYMTMKEFNSCSLGEYTRISEIVKGKLYMVLLSDLVLSGTMGDVMLNMAIIYNNNIYGYAPKQNQELDKIEALLESILSEENISAKKPVVHDKFEDFEEMVMMLAANEPSTQQDVGRIYHQIESYCI